jgi:signal transduction histidine kinase
MFLESPPAASTPTATPTAGVSVWLAPLTVFALALAVTATLVAWVAHSIEQKDRAAFDAEVIRTTDAIRERVDTVLTLLRGTAGLFAAGAPVTAAGFEAYVGRLRLRETYPGILGIGYTERLVPAQLEPRMAELRAQGLAQFRVWPEEPRGEYHAIVYLQPLDERNQAAIGYDMYTEPTRRAAMARARDEGRAAASGKVILVQEIDARKQAGFLVYLPLYSTPAAPPDRQGRRTALRGFVYSPLRVGDLLQGTRGSGEPQIDFELYDGAAVEPAALMRSTREPDAPASLWTQELRLEVAGRTWLLRFSSRPSLEAHSQRNLVPWLALASLASSLLLAWITFAQARARRHARERAEHLQRLYGELRENDRRKDEFLAVLAHELRNPLAPIRNGLEIIRRAPAGEAAARARDMADRQLRQMVRLVDDLLDVSRISRGKIVLQRERTPLARVVDAAVETSRPLIEARRHRLELGPIDPALELELDPTRVAQILINLLNNAAHYTPEGGLIQLQVDAGPREVRILVRDNGIGIAPEKLPEIFRMFVQVQRLAGGGLGIGLSLAARLAELHGGRIEAHSAGLGLGAEFMLALPHGCRPLAEG